MMIYHSVICGLLSHRASNAEISYFVFCKHEQVAAKSNSRIAYDFTHHLVGATTLEYIAYKSS